MKDFQVARTIIRLGLEFEVMEGGWWAMDVGPSSDGRVTTQEYSAQFIVGLRGRTDNGCNIQGFICPVRSRVKSYEVNRWDIENQVRQGKNNAD